MNRAMGLRSSVAIPSIAESDCCDGRAYYDEVIVQVNGVRLREVAQIWVDSKPDWWREAYDEAARRDAERINSADNTLATCWCYYCLDDPSMGLNNPVLQRMIVCPDCGSKRCPKASHHDKACTGSNDPGQKGSVYE